MSVHGNACSSACSSTASNHCDAFDDLLSNTLSHIQQLKSLSIDTDGGLSYHTLVSLRRRIMRRRRGRPRAF